MRKIYVILLGLILFQSMIIMLSPFFPTTGITEGIDDVTNDSSYTKYDVSRGSGNLLSIIGSGFVVWGPSAIIGGLALLAAFISKNYVWLGVGLFVSIITGLYINITNIITKLDVTNNSVITGMITLLAIAIGILSVFAIVDMFAPGSAVE